MCWVCERLENLIAGWNEEREFQEKTSSDRYHRGLSKGFSECVKDLSQTVASMRLKGLCGKVPEYEGAINDKQRLDILGDLLKLGDEDSNHD
jgi:hypothetical protein